MFLQKVTIADDKSVAVSDWKSQVISIAFTENYWERIIDLCRKHWQLSKGSQQQLIIWCLCKIVFREIVPSFLVVWNTFDTGSLLARIWTQQRYPLPNLSKVLENVAFKAFSAWLRLKRRCLVCNDFYFKVKRGTGYDWSRGRLYLCSDWLQSVAIGFQSP